MTAIKIANVAQIGASPHEVEDVRFNLSAEAGERWAAYSGTRRGFGATLEKAVEDLAREIRDAVHAGERE